MKKIFSTANLAFLASASFLLLRLIYWGIDSLRALPLICGLLAFILITCFLLILYIKFPLFVDQNDNNLDNSQYVRSRNIGWLICLYYCLFTAEPSQFVSLFSHKSLRFYQDGRRCSFKWGYETPRLIHRILDVILMLMLTFVSYVISEILYRWTDTQNIYFYILLFTFGALFLSKRIIFSGCLSVKAEEYNGYNVNVIYPYSNSRFTVFKQFGQAIPFVKTIAISQSAFSGNPVIKRYVIAHEIGHLHDNVRTLFISLCSIFSIVFLVFSPFWLTNNNLNYLLFVPLLLYFIYSITFRYKMAEKSEFFADRYASDLIGKRECLSALNLIKQNIKDYKENQGLSALLFKVVPIERKIEFISNEYSRKK